MSTETQSRGTACRIVLASVIGSYLACYAFFWGMLSNQPPAVPEKPAFAAASASRRSLVMTAAVGMPAADLKPFIHTLASFVSTDTSVAAAPLAVSGIDLVVLTAPNPDEEVVALLRSVNATMIPTEPQKGVQVSQLRLVMYNEWLTEHYQKVVQNYDLILLTDCRDVVFQSNPFSLANELLADYGFRSERKNAVFFAMEGPNPGGVLIEDDENNSKWVQACFGDGAFQSMKRCRIACSGVTIAHPGAMVKYVGIMTHLMASATADCLALRGSDQGIHNYVLHSLALAGQTDFVPVLTPIGDGVIANLHYIPRLQWTYDNGTAVFTDEVTGKRPAIVHQYDRDKSVFAAVNKHYEKSR